MFRFGFGEILLIFLIIIFLFGPNRLIEIAKGLGRALGEFRKTEKDIQDSVDEVTKEINDE